MKKVGIYILTDLKGRIYVGSSKDIERRKKIHFWKLRSGKHTNKKLQDYYKKYGAAGFTFSVIDLCSEDELLKREQYYIDTLKPWFNVALKVAAPPNGLGRKHTPEAIEKIRQWNLGRKHSAEAMERMKAQRNTAEGKERQKANGSKKHAGKVKKVKPVYSGVTDTARRNMSIAQTGRKHSPETIEKLKKAAKVKWMDPEYREKGLDHLNNLSNAKRKVL